MKKKVCLTCALSLIATFTSAATFEWSFGIYNSQSGSAPVNVTTYLYAIDLGGIWLGNGSFNIDTLTLTDAMFGIEYSPVGYPVTAMTTQVTPFSESLSKFTITWTTDPKLDKPTSSAMNQYWIIVFVDATTPNYFGVCDVRFFNEFTSRNPNQTWDYFSPPSYYGNLGWLQTVPEPSTVLLALVGISALCLCRRRVA